MPAVELALVSQQPVHTPGRDTLALAERLARQATPRCGRVLVVAVDGPSGSGKTTFAAELSERLGAPVIHMDDLFPGWDGLAPAPGLLTTQVLEPLARGERAAYRRWDWTADEWHEDVPVPASDVLIVEGCGSSVGPAARYAAVRVWVQADPDARMARGIARDGEAFRPQWERWARQEMEVFSADGTRDRADLVIDTTTVDTAIDTTAVDAPVPDDVTPPAPPSRRRLAAWVALGGAVGTSLRLAVDAVIGAPIGTWDAGIAVANLTGAFLLGVIALYPFRRRHPHEMRAFAGTGVMGAYTSFSALSLAAADGSPPPEAVLGLAVSILGGCAAAWLGLRVGLRARLRTAADGIAGLGPAQLDPRRFEEEL